MYFISIPPNASDISWRPIIYDGTFLINSELFNNKYDVDRSILEAPRRGGRWVAGYN